MVQNNEARNGCLSNDGGKKVAESMGFDPNTTVFNQETQDKMRKYYFNMPDIRFQKGK